MSDYVSLIISSKKTVFVYKEDIDAFFIKNKKKDNDVSNKKRELCLLGLFNNAIPNDWLNNDNWKKIKNSLDDILPELGVDNLSDFKVEYKAGRSNNYDYLFIKNDKEIKIEFKHNCNSIKSYPQFLSLASFHFVVDEVYADYFYDNYISAIIDLYDGPKISKSEYLKNIYQSDENKHEFFKFLYEKDNSDNIDDKQKNDERKKMTKKSIKEYLEKIKLNLARASIKFQESQDNKKFLLFKNDSFFKDEFENNELSISGINEITKNTIVLDTNNEKTKIILLLRWKNHIGILYPAWQIKLKR